ncbi:replication-associated recombination protein A [Candidatus Saccharibacteria bacterium]|nr:replication-associated recombination protein A [Candidatus Saccharibacteria bacterium]MCL1962691.1 replication-associated recombination protein A [Candidatus Saccharibacteria bacterium]
MENERAVPLAERMRPQTLNDVVGQEKLVGSDGILRKIVDKKEPVSLIFWGAPGTGKTTLARIIAREMDADFIEISAVIAKKADVEDVIVRARQNWNLQIRTILFVDEIHRFNKAQQDAFLPHVESGLIILIGATTENPSFEVISPLLSRSRVVVLEPLTTENIREILQRAIKSEKAVKRVTPKALDLLVAMSGSDARTALGNLELALGMTEKVTPEIVEQAVGRRQPNYNKTGGEHSYHISAFIKSMRASDPTATLYYLARMVEAGEDPKFIARRMVIFASEDIGLAGNGALNLALSAFMSIERVGMPEGGIILSHVAAALAKAKKSRESYEAWAEAKNLAKQTAHLPVPLHLRNADTKLMGELGFGRSQSGEKQQWKPGFRMSNVSYLPDGIDPKTNFFAPESQQPHWKDPY